MQIDWDHLARHLAAGSRLGPDSIHGPFHWRCVERNGLHLAQRTGASVVVVRLFALFHDSQRLDDGYDHEHGPRAAAYLEQTRGILFDLPDVEFGLLRDACHGHTDGELSADPTIGTCWDADRLDLGRVGILPSERFMSTDFGKELARRGTAYPFF